jgi:cell filamentation protein
MAEVQNRYTAQGSEAEFEPGSRGRVLRNLADVRSVREMARLESERLLAAPEHLIDEIEVDQRFRAEDICRMHWLWLGGIYAWAGEYRQVNIGKDGFMFAAAHLIPGLVKELERGPLRQFTPADFLRLRNSHMRWPWCMPR